MAVSAENSIECPVRWCTGYRDDHGGQFDPDDPRSPEDRGYPADPERWRHISAETNLQGVGYSYWLSVGGGGTTYVVAAGDAGIQLTAHTPAELFAIARPSTIAELAFAGRLADLVADRVLWSRLDDFPPMIARNGMGRARHMEALDDDALVTLKGLREATAPDEVAAWVTAHRAMWPVGELATLAALATDDDAEARAALRLNQVAARWDAGEAPPRRAVATA